LLPSVSALGHWQFHTWQLLQPAPPAAARANLADAAVGGRLLLAAAAVAPVLLLPYPFPYNGNAKHS
jgi:hypothetical protein